MVAEAYHQINEGQGKLSFTSWISGNHHEDRSHNLACSPRIQQQVSSLS